MEMIARKVPFEYCSVDHSNTLLDYYKSIYKHGTVPMVVEINQVTGQERFIGGYTDLIEYFTSNPTKEQICSTDAKG